MAEINDILLTSAANHRRAKEPECDAPSTLAPSQVLPVLTKDDGFPKTGPLLGVYWWAADIGRTWFNFDFDFDRDDLSILNAYDRLSAPGAFFSCF